MPATGVQLSDGQSGTSDRAGQQADMMGAGPIIVCFRTDASLQIGSGHVMRCLALADYLRGVGVECRFICRDHPGNLIENIRKRGYLVTVLPCDATKPAVAGCGHASLPAHAHWLGVEAHDDAEATRGGLGVDCVDWLVVDHYALERSWEQELRPHCRKLMVIDDLADRLHDCDVLLDQTFGRIAASYASLVPERCTLLLGTGYALQRPEFAALREYSLQRREPPRLHQIVVAMGGVDQFDAASQVLDALDRSRLPSECRIAVVAGAHAPWTEKVRERAKTMSRPCEVKVDVAEMAQIMADADLVIGAGGGMAWERCTLGVPAIIVVLAENQRGIAVALEKAGAARVVDNVESIAACLPLLLASIQSGDLDHVSRMAREICDGGGTSRVAAVLLDGRCRVRLMSRADLDMVLRWRNSEQVRRFMYTQRTITPSEHAAWFMKTGSDGSHHLLIVEEAGLPLGFVQFKEGPDPNLGAEWGFYASPDAGPGSGTKLARAALAYAFDEMRLDKIRGEAIGYNKRSIAFHQKLGFQEKGIREGQFFDGKRHHDVHDFELSVCDWRARS